jgi:hypothetical protein
MAISSTNSARRRAFHLRKALPLALLAILLAVAALVNLLERSTPRAGSLRRHPLIALHHGAMLAGHENCAACHTQGRGQFLLDWARTLLAKRPPAGVCPAPAAAGHASKSCATCHQAFAVK